MRTPIIDGATGEAQTPGGQSLAPPYEAGAVLSGKYRLESLLGEGGMGAVWRATNVLLDLPVAIKLIRAGLDRGALRARLQLEARSAAKLGHPAIVRVYDVGETELGDPFIVMELLYGETLAQLLSAGRLPATRAVQLLLPIIDALSVAHGRGIVHRDLKPDNVMIAQEDHCVCPKILDFGVAKLTDPRDSEHKLTEAGAVVGSPEYMSPEQARGQDDVDASTDIWSMSVVLYESLTGCPPFSASNYNALLRSIVEDDPKPLSEHAAGDGELWQIVEKGLSKDRAKRYGKISELGQALAGWLISRGSSEDACGSSLESKWLSRRIDPLLASEAAALRTPSQQSRARLAQESIPDSTGLARGPFTATVWPAAAVARTSNAGRARVLGAAALGCALLGASLFAFGHSSRSGTPITRAPAHGTSLPAAAVEAIPLRPALVQSPPEKIEVRPVGAAHAERESVATAKPTPPSARVPKPAPSAVRAAPPVAIVGGSPSASPAAPKLNRPPLDLLAPY